MYTFISPKGKHVRFKTVKEFAKATNMNYGLAKALSGGFRSTALGWCSTHPRAKKRRKQFMTLVINTITGEESIIGCNAIAFAEKHQLGPTAFNQLINGKRIAYKNWMLKKTYDKVYNSFTE